MNLPAAVLPPPAAMFVPFAHVPCPAILVAGCAAPIPAGRPGGSGGTFDGRVTEPAAVGAGLYAGKLFTKDCAFCCWGAGAAAAGITPCIAPGEGAIGCAPYPAIRGNCPAARIWSIRL